MTYVPLGYCDPSMYALDVVNGGSAWGASTLAGGLSLPCLLSGDIMIDLRDRRWIETGDRYGKEHW